MNDLIASKYSSENFMYVGKGKAVTHYGATILLYPDYFACIADEIGSDLYIIPSSTDEVIAVPAFDFDPTILKSMCLTVNETEVDAEKQLGDTIYKYSRVTRSIGIALQ